MLNIFIKNFSPPYSPDLNPIEMMWADLKRYVRSKFCKSKRDVLKYIEKFQREVLTTERCNHYIDHLIKVDIAFMTNVFVKSFFLLYIRFGAMFY